MRIWQSSPQTARFDKRNWPLRLDLLPKKSETFDESQHPRDEAGRFTDSGSGGRIAPVRGVTKREGLWQGDLTMKELPKETQADVKKSFARMGVTPKQATKNLVAQFEAAPKELRDQYRTWYNEAHDFNARVARDTGLDERVVTAITAANSPGGRWSSNQEITEIVGDMWKNKDTELTDEQAAKINDRLDGLKGRDTGYRVEAGQSYEDIMRGDARAGAVMIGVTNGIQLRSYDNLTKSVQILAADDQLRAIDEVLAGPKVRSFYNNMRNPDGNEDVCIDKHMMRVMVNGTGSPDGEQRMRDIEDDTTITGTPKYKTAGIGSYPLFADVVRAAASEVNATHAGEPGFPMLDHEVQAVIWGQQITQYPLGTMRKILNEEP